MLSSTSEVIPYSSLAELERDEIIQDDSGLLRPDESESRSSLPPQDQGEQQAFQGTISHRTSLEFVVESRPEKHQSDNLKGVPRSLSFSWSSLTADAVSILATIPFIVLGFLLAQAKGEAVERNALQNFENGIRIAATALPFVFAAIFGRLTAQVARWKLERGGSLPSIEQWLGSRTLFSAFLTQVKLGGLNVIGLSMTIAWALSPLGAQSILRVMGTGPRDVNTNGSVTYLDTNTPSAFTVYNIIDSSPHGQDIPAVINSIYAASLMSADSIKSSGQDSWGNIKIPYFFPDADSLSADAWVSLPVDGSVEYSSLVGLPFVVDIDPMPGVRSNFMVETSHIQLQCSPFVTTGARENGYLDPSILSNYENSTLSNSLCTPSLRKLPKNGTFQAYTSGHGEATDTFPWILALGTFLDPLWLGRICNSEDKEYHGLYSPAALANEEEISTSQAKLQLLTWSESIDTPRSNPLSTTCGVSQSWVESRVDCDWSNSPACAVTAQRLSLKQHASSNITHLSFPNVFTNVNVRLPRASGLEYILGISDASLVYLVNTSSSYMLNLESREGSLENLTESEVSRRLGQLINTYLMISQFYEYISTGTLGKDLSRDLGPPTKRITTTTWIRESERIYTINTSWLAAFFVTAVAMLVGSIVGAVFCHSSITPEILGFASAAIRDSKHVDLAPGFGALGGLEMTKAFEKIEFRYGVVNKSESGQQVLGVSWKVSAERVKKRMPYV